MQRSPQLTRRQWLALAGAVAGGVGVSWLLRQGVPIGDDLGQSAAARAVLADDTAPTIGPADADLTMAIFTDYRCGACRASYPALMRAVRSDGRVRLRVLDWPVFGAASQRAARVALAAARQGRYEGVHDRLMTDPRPIDEAMLADVVAQAGGDWSRIERDIANYAGVIDARLARTAQAALALGLPGTPAYLIGRYRVVGALDDAEFHRAFAQARAA